MRKNEREAAALSPDDIDQVSAEYSDLFAALLPPEQAAAHRRSWYQERQARHGWTDAQVEAHFARDSARCD